MLPSSRGLGHIPFTDAAGVQIPLGVPLFIFLYNYWSIEAERLFFINKNMKHNEI